MTGRTKFAYATLSVLIALLLWFYVVGIEKPTKEETIPGVVVTLKGEEELRSDYSLVVTSNKKMSIDVTVQGNIMDVAALRNNRGEITAEADLSIVTTAGTHQLMYDITLPDGFSDIISVTGLSPAYVSVKVEKVQTSLVDVELINEVSVAEGYIADPVEIQPEKLIISGPEATVSRIARAEAIWSREDVDHSITTQLDYTLYDKFGQEIDRSELTIDQEYITASMEVMQQKEIPLTIKLESGGGAEENDATVSFDPPSITVKGDPTILSGLSSIQLESISLKDQVSRTGKYNRTIPLPNDVENISGETECMVTVELEGLETRTFYCENISVIGAPDGYTPILTTNQIRIVIRGKSADVAEVTENNLRVVADISDLTSTAYGSVSVPADVFVDGHSTVGAIGEYKVAVNILTDEEAEALFNASQEEEAEAGNG